MPTNDITCRRALEAPGLIALYTGAVWSVEASKGNGKDKSKATYRADSQTVLRKRLVLRTKARTAYVPGAELGEDAALSPGDLFGAYVDCLVAGDSYTRQVGEKERAQPRGTTRFRGTNIIVKLNQRYEINDHDERFQSSAKAHDPERLRPIIVAALRPAQPVQAPVRLLDAHKPSVCKKRGLMDERRRVSARIPARNAVLSTNVLNATWVPVIEQFQMRDVPEDWRSEVHENVSRLAGVDHETNIDWNGGNVVRFPVRRDRLHREEDDAIQQGLDPGKGGVKWHHFEDPAFQLRWKSRIGERRSKYDVHRNEISSVERSTWGAGGGQKQEINEQMYTK
ncbi:hypothetical protein B0H19DRAFT_1080734 [Mycena capillaripes]|nr:hypothetical protein B0H19DRAFT_1080734 [Mycena capillaripes]